MRIFRKYRYESLAMLLAVAFLSVALYLGTEDSANSARPALLLVLIADGIALYFTVRELWRTKWKMSFLETVQKIVAKIAKRLTDFIEKRTRGKKTTVLTGKTTVSFDYPLQESSKKKSPKALRWRRLKDDREKLGYLYKNMIENKIKHGSLIYSSYTPSEAKSQDENKAFENRIFDLYIDNRYKQNVETDAETLDSLKNELNRNA